MIKHLSKAVMICFLLLLSGCAREVGQENLDDNTVESEVETATLEESPLEINDTLVGTVVSSENEFAEESAFEPESNVGIVDEVVLEQFPLVDGILCVTDIVEGYNETEEHHQIYANFVHDEVVNNSIYLGDFYYYPEYQSMMIDYKFLVSSVDKKNYFLYQVMSGIEGPGVDYYLFEIRENDLVEERSVLDPGYSDGRQLFDATGIDKDNYYTEGTQLTDLADENYEKILSDIFRPYNISVDDLLIRPEW